MRPLSAFELFTIWDENSSLPLLQKSLRLLANAFATDDIGMVSRFSIGERDRRLLQLREWMFGPVLTIKAICTACSETAEWETAATTLHLQPLRPNLSPSVFILEKEGFTIRFRLPDSHDLATAMEESADLLNDKKILLDCIVEAVKDGEAQQLGVLPDHLLQALEQRMSEEDPQADIRMNMVCPTCSHKWEAGFDIAGFLWAEIDSWAYRLMDEVALLARAFGWPEKDIVNMSARRRYLYIQMLGS